MSGKSRIFFMLATSMPMIRAPATVVPFLISARFFSVSAPAYREKYYKITRYAKPVETTVYKAGDSKERLKIPATKKLYPDYHYEAMFFKRQNKGLFGGLQRSRSKTCSEAGNKGLRAHLPNIVPATLWSETLNRSISTKVTTSVLRTITKEGGLDNYLTKDKPARIKTLGLKGWQLRYDVMKQRELSELPLVKVEDKNRQVRYVHRDGKQVFVGRQKLLKQLFPIVKRDSYQPVTWGNFMKNHRYLTTEEIVDKLEGYNFDFSEVAVCT